MKTNVKQVLVNDINVDVISITNEKDFEVELLSLGATLNKILVDGKIMNVTPNTLEEHFNNSGKFGKVIGRYAGRIEGGKFSLNGMKYQLDINNGTN